MNVINRGSDVPIRFTLKTSGTLTPIDLSSLTGYIAILYYEGSGKVLAKFSRNTIAGYSDIIVIDSANGVFACNLESAVTASAECGIILAEIKTQSTDTDFENDTFHTVVRDLEVGDIKAAISKSVAAL